MTILEKRSTHILVRLRPYERNKIKILAEKKTKGNISALVRQEVLGIPYTIQMRQIKRIRKAAI